METLGQVNNREIIYIWTRQTEYWADRLPASNWLVLFIGDDRNIDNITDMAQKCLEQNVCYVCTAGQERELIHEIFDELIVTNQIARGKTANTPDDFENSAMTTSHDELKEGFWFATTLAFHDTIDIKKVICLDTTEKGKRQDLLNLTVKMSS